MSRFDRLRGKLSWLVRDPDGALVTLAILVVAPTVAFPLYLFLTANGPGRPDGTSTYILRHPLGVALSLLVVLLLVIGLCETRRKREFWQRGKEWVQQIIRPLLWGAFVGLLAFVAYLLLTIRGVRFDPDNVLATSLQLYLACCGVFVAFHGIFYEKMPILDLGILMDRLTDDLTRCSGKVVFAYPGLSLGSISVGGTRYTRYVAALEGLLDRHDIAKHFVVYNAEDIIGLYGVYVEHLIASVLAIPTSRKTEHLFSQDEMGKIGEALTCGRSDEVRTLVQGALGTAGYDRVKKQLEGRLAYRSAIDTAMRDSLRLMETMQHDADETARLLKPLPYEIAFVEPAFRSYAIIIDDVIYFLSPFGLPIWSRNEGKFVAAAEPEETLIVDFLATRVKNAAVAAMYTKLIRGESHEFDSNPKLAGDIKDTLKLYGIEWQ